MKSNLLTSSRLHVLRACMRLHRIEYELGFRPLTEEEALRFGTLIHLMLAAWWNAPDGERLEAALAVLASNPQVDPFEAVRAEWMLRGYHVRWEADMQHFEVLGVERHFNTELRNPNTGRPSQTFRLAGKLDVIVRDVRDGLVRLIEHKTSSDDIHQGSEYWRRLRMDAQVSVYFEGAKSLGFGEVAECLYDVLGKVKLRPLKATPEADRKYVQKTGKLYANQRAADETPEEYRERVVEALTADPDAFYQRGPVVRLESEMQDAMFDIWQQAQLLREAELAGRAPRNPDACVRFGRTCAFFDVCTGVASLEDPARFAQNDDVHPELSDAPKEEVVQ